MPPASSQAPFAASGFFAWRTPLLPFDELLAWGEGLEAPGAIADADRLEAALIADRGRLRERLRAAAARPEVRDALCVASPDLDDSLDVWRRQPDGDRGQKVERALVRYVQRMAGRATPFGLFSGCSVGTLGPETRLMLPERAAYRRHTRLDMGYLVSLAEALEREPAVRAGLTYRPNSSLYRVAGRVRYTEVRRDGKTASHRLVGIEPTDYLEATLARARDGTAAGSLAAALVEADPEASRAEAEEYVGELIAGQVLVSDSLPSVTGPEPIHGLVQCLNGSLRAEADLSDRLGQAQAALEAIDAAGLGVDPECYRAVTRLLEALPARVEVARLFQVDLTKPAARAALGPGPLAEIRRGVEVLRRLARRVPHAALKRFREAFVERYQGQDVPERERRWVPLVEALDEEVGIGFGAAAEASDLLDGLEFPARPDETIPWGKRETLLLRKLSEALAGGAAEIVLTADDLDELAVPDPAPLPDAFAVMATLAAADEAAPDRGDFRVSLGGVSGPSGAVLLGRFCHADPELRRHVEAHLRAEEALQPEAIFAEIVHLPEEGRLGNILLRPVLRPYEIPYLSPSRVPADRQLPLTDLAVSVVGEQVVLRSARLGRRVIPRLTSAHNFSRGQTVYRFLCALQGQGSAARWGWDWGPLGDAPFLPRVVSGRLVLSRARWLVGKEELRAFAKAAGAALFAAVRGWRARRRLPRWVALADYDNELPVDLDNVLSVEAFVDAVKGRDKATLVELFPGPDELCARGPEGRFVHELVVPFVRAPSASGAAAVGERSPDRRLPVAPRPHVRRTFPPGSAWLYAKLYTGTATADQVLCDLVKPLTGSVLRSGAADLWFFLRYADPDHHLRLRFHGAPERLQAEVLPALQAAAAPLLDDGRVWKLQLDTYEREVERYGGAEGIELAEQLFHADSEAVLELVELYRTDVRGEARWRLAVCGIDRQLEDLGLDLAGRRGVLRRVRGSFAREFRADARLKRQLGDRYRKERRDLEALLDPTRTAGDVLAPGLVVLRRRSERWAAVTAELRARERAVRLAQPVAELAPSYVHVHVNRLLRSAQRAHEMVLYDFLDRLYESAAARAPGVRQPA